MSIEVLISTMHQAKDDYSLLSRMNIQTRAVVINQCDNYCVKMFEFRKNPIIWIDTKDRGLSKSRNLALRYSTADICLLADDDEILIDGYERIILDAFERNQQADLIRFKVLGIEKKFKKYSNVESKLSWFTSMKISSVEVAFRRKRVLKNSIRFNEHIGSGTQFMMGEENVFCWDCLRKKLKIHYAPQVIANLHIGDSSWFKGYNKDYFVSRGAAFTAMSRFLSIPLILQFAVRKGSLYQNEFSVLLSVKFMLLGRKQYLKQCGRE